MLVTFFHMHSTIGKRYLEINSNILQNVEISIFFNKKNFECAPSHWSKFNNPIQNIYVNAIVQFQIELQ